MTLAVIITDSFARAVPSASMASFHGCIATVAPVTVAAGPCGPPPAGASSPQAARAIAIASTADTRRETFIDAFILERNF